MPKTILKTPDNLSNEDWQRVLAVCDSWPRQAVLKLWEEHNVPQPADELFGESHVNFGQERVNDQLRKGDLPFRMTRIGKWVKDEDRAKRTMALVPKDWVSP